jgi:hypothetical protein
MPGLSKILVARKRTGLYLNIHHVIGSEINPVVERGNAVSTVGQISSRSLNA